MGRKHILRKAVVMDAADIATNPKSDPTVVEQLDFFAYDLSWDSLDISGQAFVEVNNDENLTASSEWKRLNFGENIALDTTEDSHTILVKDVHFKRARLAYESASGAGTLTVAIKGGTKGA